MTFTTTPIVKAEKAFHPTGASSRKRVVSPMLKKQKMKVHVRSETSGVIRLGFTTVLKSAGL